MGKHCSTQLEEHDTISKYKQWISKVCANKTSFKCNKRSKPGFALVLCKQPLRDGFERFHDERIYDVKI